MAMISNKQYAEQMQFDGLCPGVEGRRAWYVLAVLCQLWNSGFFWVFVTYGLIGKMIFDAPT